MTLASYFDFESTVDIFPSNSFLSITLRYSICHLGDVLRRKGEDFHYVLGGVLIKQKKKYLQYFLGDVMIKEKGRILTALDPF